MHVFFSLVVPTLNEERYISKLLTSLSKQTFKDFEVIICDGKSNDNTTLIIQRHMKKNPLYTLVESSKRGPSVQRNIGAKQARGKYIIFFDADVQLPPEFLAGLYYEISKRRSPPLLTTWLSEDVYSSQATVVVGMTNVLLELAKIMGKPAAPGFNIIVKRSIFRKMRGFDENVLMSEDYEFTLRAMDMGCELTILKEPRLLISLRRFRTEGTFKLIYKFTHANLHFLLKGPITTQIFEYSMGGHVHQSARLKKQDTYTRKLKTIEATLNRFFTT